MVNISTIPPKQRNTTPRENKDYRGKKLTVRVRSCLQSYRRSDRVKILPRSWSSLRRTTEENSTLSHSAPRYGTYTRGNTVFLSLFNWLPLATSWQWKHWLSAAINHFPHLCSGDVCSRKSHIQTGTVDTHKEEKKFDFQREKKKKTRHLEQKNRREEKRRAEQL